MLSGILQRALGKVLPAVLLSALLLILARCRFPEAIQTRYAA
jgi:hypothetical protein